MSQTTQIKIEPKELYISLKVSGYSDSISTILNGVYTEQVKVDYQDQQSQVKY